MVTFTNSDPFLFVTCVVIIMCNEHAFYYKIKSTLFPFSNGKRYTGFVNG